MLTIVIDPGHGGLAKVGGSSPNNATGPAGTLEKNVTLNIARALKSALPQSVELILTRDTDTNLGLADRAAIARNSRADIFISIHLNGWHSPNVQGTECFHYPGTNASSQTLAGLVQSETVKVTGLRDRGVKTERLGVLNPTRHNRATASCLLEVSFLTDPTEEARLNDQTYIKQLGGAIAQACKAFIANKYDDILTPQENEGSDSEMTFHTLSNEEFELEDGTSLSGLPAQQDTRNQSLNSKSAGVQQAIKSSESELQTINGIGPVTAKKLTGLSINNLAELSEIPRSGIPKYAEILKVSPETIEDWIRQAKP